MYFGQAHRGCSSNVRGTLAAREVCFNADMAYLYMIHATPAALITWHCRVAKVVLGKMAIKNARHRVGGGRPSMPCPGIFHFSLTTAAGLSFHWRQSRVAFESILWNTAAAAAAGNTPSWNFCKRSLSIVLFGRVLQYCVPGGRREFDMDSTLLLLLLPQEDSFYIW